MDTKICRTCHTPKAVNLFHRNASKRDGRQDDCIVCAGKARKARKRETQAFLRGAAAARLAGSAEAVRRVGRQVETYRRRFDAGRDPLTGRALAREEVASCKD